MRSHNSWVKGYNYLLKLLLVGDSDVGKGEILENLHDHMAEHPPCLQQQNRMQDDHHPAGQPAGQAGAPKHNEPSRSASSSRPTPGGAGDSSGGCHYQPLVLPLHGLLDQGDPRACMGGGGGDREVPWSLAGTRLHLVLKRQVTTEQVRLRRKLQGLAVVQVLLRHRVFCVIESFVVLLPHSMEIWRLKGVFSLQNLWC